MSIEQINFPLLQWLVFSETKNVRTIEDEYIDLLKNNNLF